MLDGSSFKSARRLLKRAQANTKAKSKQFEAYAKMLDNRHYNMKSVTPKMLKKRAQLMSEYDRATMKEREAMRQLDSARYS